MAARDISNPNRIIYTTVLSGAAFVTTTSTLLGVTLPDIQCLLGVDLKTSSSLLFAYGLGLCCSNLTVHFINDKVDTCLFLTVILVLNAVVIAAVPTSPFLWLTIFLILIAGWCSGICAFVRTLHCFFIWPDNAFVVSVVQSGASLNMISVPLVSNLFRHSQQSSCSEGNRLEEAVCNMTITHPNSEKRCDGFNTNMRYLYVIISGLCLLVAMCLMCCYSTILKQSEVVEVSKPRNKATAANKSNLFMCLTICFSFTCSTFLVFFQELFVTFGIRSQLNLSISDMSMMYSVFNVTIFFSRLSSIVLSVGIGLDMIMYVYVLISSVASVLFVIFQDSSITMMWANSLLFAVGIGPIFPGFLAWMKEYSDGSLQLLNVVLFYNFLGVLVSPAICGVMMGMIGASAFVYMVSGTGVLQCVLFMFMSCNI